MDRSLSPSSSSSRWHNFSTGGAGRPCGSSKGSSAGGPHEVSPVASLLERLCQSGDNEQAQCLLAPSDSLPHLDRHQDIHQNLRHVSSALAAVPMPADSLPHLDHRQNLRQNLSQNLRQELATPPPAALAKKMKKKTKKRKGEEPGNGDSQTEPLFERRVLNWGSGLKRPRGSRTQEQIPPRLPPPPLSERRLSCVVTRRGHVEREKQVVNPPVVAFQPSTPSPQDSTSRLLTSNGQDLGTVLNKQTPWYYSRQSGRIPSTGRVTADQSGSSPCKRQSLEETEEGSRAPSRPTIEREGSRTPSRPAIERECSRPHSRPTIERDGLRPPPPTIERVAFEWPRIIISLSRKEKEEDFLIMKGSKLPQRPKRRLKAVQKTLRYCIPGNWLSDITRNRYEVREKKSIRKKPAGLKAMESLESDSDS